MTNCTSPLNSLTDYILNSVVFFLMGKNSTNYKHTFLLSLSPIKSSYLVLTSLWILVLYFQLQISPNPFIFFLSNKLFFLTFVFFITPLHPAKLWNANSILSGSSLTLSHNSSIQSSSTDTTGWEQVSVISDIQPFSTSIRNCPGRKITSSMTSATTPGLQALFPLIFLQSCARLNS